MEIVQFQRRELYRNYYQITYTRTVGLLEKRPKLLDFASVSAYSDLIDTKLEYLDVLMEQHGRLTNFLSDCSSMQSVKSLMNSECLNRMIT